MKNWERGGPPTAAAPRRRTPSAASPTSAPASTCARCCATPPPALMHSMIYFGFLVLLGVTTVLEIDHQLPEDLKFLHGRTYQAYSFVGDARRRRVPRRHRVGDRAPLRAAAVPHPHQDQARARRRSSARSSLIGAQRLRRRDVPHRPRSSEPELREVELHRLPAEPARRRLRRSTRCDDWHQGLWIGHVVAFIAFLAILPITMLRHMFTSPLNMYLQRPRPPEGRDEADAEPRPRPSSRRSAPRSSRTSRGSSCSTPTPARCAAAARACARPTPPASRSTRARSCSRSAR